ncbi:MAG TPA: cytochrome P450, partial [Kofleriaceae bacterium]|nr:cytochrome P450 [Kofleriaceae bacterium]
MQHAARFAPVPLADAPGLPLVGSLIDLRRDRLGLHHRAVMQADVTRLRVAWRTAWIVGSHPLAHQVLVDDADAFVKTRQLAEFGRPLLGRGLLTAEGGDHRRQRKLMAPAFAPRRMAGYGGVMAARAAAAADRLRPGARIDLAAEMMALTLDIVGRTLFDADLAGLARAVAESLTVAMEYIIGSITLPLPYEWPLPRNRRLRAAVARLDEVVLRIIGERRRRAADRGDVLSILLEAKDDDGVGLGDRELRDEIMTLMLAGHETTANLLSWTWVALAGAPEV